MGDWRDGFTHEEFLAGCRRLSQMPSLVKPWNRNVNPTKYDRVQEVGGQSVANSRSAAPSDAPQTPENTA